MSDPSEGETSAMRNMPPYQSVGGQGAPVYSQPMYGQQPVPYPNDPYAHQGYVAGGSVSGVAPVAVPAVPVMAVSPQRQAVCCGCTKGCCAMYLNLALGLMILLSWIGCCVIFGGELHEVQVSLKNPSKWPSNFTATATASFRWNKFNDFDGITHTYNDINDLSSCSSDGKGDIAVYVFAFIALTVFLPLLFARLSGKYIRPANLQRFVGYELGLIILSFILYLIGIIIWASCTSASSTYASNKWNPSSVDLYDVTVFATGYGYAVFCFLLMIASLVHIVVIRNDPYYVAMGRVELIPQPNLGQYGENAVYGQPVYGQPVPVPV